MTSRTKSEPSDNPVDLSADEQIERVVQIIMEQFNGDTRAYFDSLPQQSDRSENESEEEIGRAVESFLRLYR